MKTFYNEVALGRIKIIESQALFGSKRAVTYHGACKVWVSPAMATLLTTDFDSVMKSLEVLILPNTVNIDQAVLRIPQEYCLRAV